MDVKNSNLVYFLNMNSAPARVLTVLMLILIIGGFYFWIALDQQATGILMICLGGLGTSGLLTIPLLYKNAVNYNRKGISIKLAGQPSRNLAYSQISKILIKEDIIRLTYASKSIEIDLSSINTKDRKRIISIFEAGYSEEILLNTTAQSL